jgi:tetratricopeptide (TPR) repeat protein
MRIFPVILLSLPLVCGCRSGKAEARALAEAAYYELKGDPLDVRVQRDAELKIGRSKRANPREAWAYLAEAELRLDTGYAIGSMFDSSSYGPGTVAGALDAALRAYELDSSNHTAEAVLARMYIIQGDNQTAFVHLRRIYDQDPANFYPPFLLGRIYLKSAHPEQALPHLEQAERAAQLGFQKIAAMSALAKAYELCDRPTDEERMDKEILRLEPDDAYHHEAYGHFLERAGRLDEAISSYRKGAALRPYPNILRLLHEAMQKRDSLSRTRI